MTSISLRTFSAVLTLLTSAAVSLNASAQTNNNVLLIIVDDLGFGDLSCQGAKDLRTPNIDALIADSLKLDRFYANCPVCSPTRASVLTGHYPDRVGVPGVIRTTLTNSWGYYDPPSPTLPELVKSNGYQTAAIGKWHLGLEPENHPNKRGFDHFEGFLGDMMDDYYDHRRRGFNYMRRNRDEIDPEGHATDLFSKWASDYIVDNNKSPLPWFMYLAYNAPHTPIQPPQQWLDKVKAREPDITDTRAKLVALIEHMDNGIGDVIATLKSTGNYENTTIIFTSDNGGQVNVGANNGSLRDGKQSMYEGGLRIPASIRIPGRTKPGSVTTAIASTVDLLPTILDVECGKQVTATDGRSLLPLVDAPETLWPDREVYFVRREGGGRYSGLTIEAVMVGDYKLLHNLPTAPFELYDLANDPQETTDLSKKRPKVYKDLQQRLQRHVQRGGRIKWQK